MRVDALWDGLALGSTGSVSAQPAKADRLGDWLIQKKPGLYGGGGGIVHGVGHSYFVNTSSPQGRGVSDCTWL